MEIRLGCQGLVCGHIPTRDKRGTTSLRYRDRFYRRAHDARRISCSKSCYPMNRVNHRVPHLRPWVSYFSMYVDTSIDEVFIEGV